MVYFFSKKKKDKNLHMSQSLDHSISNFHFTLIEIFLMILSVNRPVTMVNVTQCDFQG